jgi:hypothetical protein
MEKKNTNLPMITAFFRKKCIRADATQDHHLTGAIAIKTIDPRLFHGHDWREMEAACSPLLIRSLLKQAAARMVPIWGLNQLSSRA